MKEKSEERVKDLRKIREMRGWTQRQVADMLDLPDVRTVRRWERGEVYPSLRHRRALCALFEINDVEIEAILSKREPDGEVQLPSEEEGVALPVPVRKISQSRMDWYRQRLLEKVQAFWISGVLERSLKDVPYLSLVLYETPNAVTTSWASIMLQPELPARLYVPETGVLQCYDAAGGDLMILGAAGAGKTTLLLELARELLRRAQQEPHHPIPVVLNLASWSVKADSFMSWLQEELKNKYQLPARVGSAWIEEHALLPMLDGLDEVEPSLQRKCMDAIVDYRRDHGFEPMVICCREDVYKEMHRRMLLQQAINVQPLTHQQIGEYLDAAGESHLQRLLMQDRALYELVTTPLMLRILTLSARDQVIEANYDSQEKWSQHLFSLYTRYMLSRRQPHYSYRQSVRWLSWIAQQMKMCYQTEFYLERLQLTSLASVRQQRLCQGVSAGLWVGLLVGGLVGCIDVPFDNLFEGLVVTPCLALVFALCAGVLGAQLERFLPTVVKKVSFGSMLGAAIGGVGIWINRYLPGDDILYGAVGGLAIVVTFVMLSLNRITIEPIEVVSWSWERLKKSFSSFLLLGMVLTAVVGVAGGLFGWYVAGLGIGMIVVLFFGVISFLIVGLLGGLSGRMLDERLLERPNQGIHRSAMHALQSGVVAGVFNWVLLTLASVLVLKCFPNLVVRSNFLLFGRLAFAWVLGLGVAIYTGGDACVKHFLLRFLLWRAKRIPWNCTRFLDYSADHLVLRKVGAGYIFVHRLLLEYFVSLRDHEQQ